MRGNMQWEAPLMPTAACDLRLLPEQETPPVMERIGSWTKRFQQVVSSESKTRHKYEKNEWTKRESSRRKVWLQAWTQDEDGQSLAGNVRQPSAAESCEKMGM